MSKNRTCIVCGTAYEYCPHCNQYNSDETWRSVYCSEDCRTIFNVCSKYVANKLSASAAKEELKKITIPNNIISDGLKKNIEEINKSVTENKTITENKPTETKKKATTEKGKTDTEDTPKPKYKRRRMKKSEDV